MKLTNIAGYNDINSFVENKLKLFDNSERSFNALFDIMFSERENIMYEKSEGYRIVKTTYGQAYDSILKKRAALSRMLTEYGHDSVVGIYMQNSENWIETFWCVLSCGFRPLLMNMRLDRDTLEEAIHCAGAVAIISDGAQFSVKTIFSDDIAACGDHCSDCTFGSEILVMSSGTSSKVKICAYSANEFYYQIKGSYGIIRECSAMKEHYMGQLKLLTFLPFYHIFGLVAVYIWFAFFSRTFVHLNDMMPQTIVNTIKRHKVTHVFAVPLFWEKVYSQAIKTIKNRGNKTYAKYLSGMRTAEKLSRIPGIGSLFSRIAFREVRENLFGPSVRFMITGGSMIKEPVLSFFNNIGYRLVNGYGMSEIGITSVELSSDRALICGAYVGKPMDGIEYRIDENGELLVRGKATAKYILTGGERTERGQWFCTHDLACCEKGHYKILGRCDDLVISSGGENLNPNLIEPRLTVPGIKGVCLVSTGDDGECLPTLIVSIPRYVSKERFANTDRAVKEKLNELQLGTQISKIVYTGDDLMLKDEFKLNRTRLSQACKNGTLSTVTTADINDEICDEITSAVRSLFAGALEKEPGDISIVSDFFLDEGGSSLDYLTLISELQAEFDISFPEGIGTPMNTVKALSEYIKAEIDNVD